MNEISPINFFKLYQRNVNFKIIDVREVYEYDRYHILGAINIPFAMLVEKHYLFLNPNNQYYIICKNGVKSIQATEYLANLGYQAVNVIGGIDRWAGKFYNN